MKNSTLSRAIATAAVCALGLATLGSVKNPVERPVKVGGQNTVTVNLLNGTWEFVGSALVSHAGSCTSYASGYLDTDGNLVGTGIAIAADGDQSFFEMPGTTWYVQMTGGTGRFEHSTGGWNLVSRTMIDEHVNDDGTIISMTYSYVGVGTVTY
ncbi:MAG: hypothetical protein AB9869_20940 [Verrucomicrobiia bacterium]